MLPLHRSGKDALAWRRGAGLKGGPARPRASRCAGTYCEWREVRACLFLRQLADLAEEGQIQASGQTVTAASRARGLGGPSRSMERRAARR